MAIQRDENVIRVSGAGALEDLGNVVTTGVKYVGSAAGAVTFRSPDSAGITIYERDGATDTFEQVKISAQQNLNVEITSSAVCYIYTR